MGVSQSKVSCLWLPAQSGKTRKIQELIELYRDMRILVRKTNGRIVSDWDENKIKEMDDEDDDSIIEETIDDNYFNIIICSNNSMLASQTHARMNNEMFSSSFIIHEDDKKEVVQSNEEDCNVYAWISANKEKRSVRDIAYSINRDQLKMLVCCSHATRMEDYLYPLIRMLNEDFTRKLFRKKINIWIDEADSSINLWSKYEKILDMDVINKVTLVSATFNSIINKYKKISVIPFKDTHPECYVKLQDTNMIISEDKRYDAFGYIKYVIRKNKLLEELKPGYCLFAPGDITVESHINICTHFYANHGCAVAILNGKHKKIFVPGMNIIDLTEEMNTKNPEEVGKILARKYKEHKLDKFPFVITGQICLGRGITFQSGSFLFTASIIPYIANKASLYQCATRVIGNIKHLVNETHIMYCSKKTRKILLEMESCAVNVAKILFENNQTEVDKSVMKRASNIDGEDDEKYKGLKSYVKCDLLEFKVDGNEKNAWKEVASVYKAHKGNEPSSKSLPKKNDDGFYECSTTGKLSVHDYSIKSIIEGWKWYSNFQLKADGFKYARIYVGYNDKTDNSKYSIFLRLMSIKENKNTSKKLEEFRK
jgi:hypothetical protein